MNAGLFDVKAGV